MAQYEVAERGNKKRIIICIAVALCVVLAAVAGVYYFFIRCEHEYDSGVTAEPASCVEEGVCVFTCKHCGKTTEETIPFADHVFKDENIKEPTCGDAGKMMRTCTVCDYSLEEDIPATGNHSFSEKITREPSCDKEGEKELTCKNCAFVELSPIEKTAHTYKYKTTKKATCIEKGVKTQICSECEATGKTKETALAEHKFVESVKTAASCTVEGEKICKCSVCDYSKVETIPVTEHPWNDWKVEKEATFETTGKRTRKCSTCSKTESETIPVRTLTYEEKRKMAYEVAQSIASSIDSSLPTLDRITYAAQVVADYCSAAEYTTEGSDYCEAYGVFIKGEFSCAGATRALGMVLDCMGYSWNHMNENQWTHQWCQVFVNGQEYWADGQIGFAGTGKHPYV